MITASDVSRVINETDPRIDGFIEKVLLPKFIDLGRSISIPTKDALDYFNNEISNRRFQEQISKRGFFIEEKFDDRPGSPCWFVIQVPPQGE